LPSSMPSGQPSSVPTSQPTMDEPYPVISFGMRYAITIDLPTFSGLTASENASITNATSAVLLKDVKNIYARVSSVSAAPGGTRGTRLVVQVSALLKQAKFCNYDDAFVGFANQIKFFVENPNQLWMDKVINEVEDGSPLKDAFSVSVTSEPFGDTQFVQTSARACTHKPTSAPTTISQGQSDGAAAGVTNSSSNNYVTLYFVALVVFALMSIAYVFYSNRNKSLVRLDMGGGSGSSVSGDSETSDTGLIDSRASMAAAMEPHSRPADLMMYNEATGEFEIQQPLGDDVVLPDGAYDYDVEDEVLANQNAFGWTSADAAALSPSSNPSSAMTFTSPAHAASTGMSMGSAPTSSASRSGKQSKSKSKSKTSALNNLGTLRSGPKSSSLPPLAPRSAAQPPVFHAPEQPLPAVAEAVVATSYDDNASSMWSMNDDGNEN
jgi:hypothetical protein